MTPWTKRFVAFGVLAFLVPAAELFVGVLVLRKIFADESGEVALVIPLFVFILIGLALATFAVFVFLAMASGLFASVERPEDPSSNKSR